MTNYPPNTVIVQPKPRGPSGLWFLFTALGALLGAGAYALITTGNELPRTTMVVNAPAPVEETVVIQIRAVLEAPTATVTAIPTLRPTSAPAAPTISNECGPKTLPDQLCKVPFPATSTATTVPDCSANSEAGDWCTWKATEVVSE